MERGLGAVPRYIQFYSDVFALLSLPPLVLHASTLFNNNMRRIWINRLIPVLFYSLYITKTCCKVPLNAHLTLFI